MEHRITPISGNLTRGANARPRPVVVPDLPDDPPASLGPEYHIAARVIDDLAAACHVNLHFEIDEAANLVHVQILDHDRQLIREIPARTLLDSLSGDSLPPIVRPSVVVRVAKGSG